MFTRTTTQLQAVDDFVCFDEIFPLFARALSDANKLSAKIEISLLSWSKREAKNLCLKSPLPFHCGDVWTALCKLWIRSELLKEKRAGVGLSGGKCHIHSSTAETSNHKIVKNQVTNTLTNFLSFVFISLRQTARVAVWDDGAVFWDARRQQCRSTARHRVWIIAKHNYCDYQLRSSTNTKRDSLDDAHKPFGYHKRHHIVGRARHRDKMPQPATIIGFDGSRESSSHWWRCRWWTAARLRNSVVSPSEDTKVGEDKGWYSKNFSYPWKIHRRSHSQIFVLLLSMLVTLQQALSSGYINSVITTIEKRFDIPSSLSGLIASSYEIGNVITVIFVSYLGSRRHIPVWIGIGKQFIGIFTKAPSTSPENFPLRN